MSIKPGVTKPEQATVGLRDDGLTPLAILAGNGFPVRNGGGLRQPPGFVSQRNQPPRSWRVRACTAWPFRVLPTCIVP
jgi:hypothetical protein